MPKIETVAWAPISPINFFGILRRPCWRHAQVAAVVGMSVPLELLVAVHPLVDTPAALRGDLDSLVAAQFLRADAGGNTWSWTQACH